jgi:hypothetical protein
MYIVLDTDKDHSLLHDRPVLLTWRMPHDKQSHICPDYNHNMVDSQRGSTSRWTDWLALTSVTESDDTAYRLTKTLTCYGEMTGSGQTFMHTRHMVKLSLCLTKYYNHEGVLGSGGTAPRILDLGTKWRWVVSFTPRPLYPQGKNPWYPLDRRLGGPQNRSGRGGEEKTSQPPPGIEP